MLLLQTLMGKRLYLYLLKKWKHGIFIQQINSCWEIGFVQSVKTRLLMDKEVIDVLEKWCFIPSIELLEGYTE